MNGSHLEHLAELGKLAEQAADSLAEPVARYAHLVLETLKSGHAVLWAGNGGSAAHAQHIATEYVIRYRPLTRRAARAIALSTDSSILTAGGNDLGFEEIFARQVEAHGTRGDLLVLVSTSGSSPNLLRAQEVAKGRGMKVVGLLGGNGGKLAGLVDIAIVVPSTDTAHIQELQLAIDHYVCSVIEPKL